MGGANDLVSLDTNGEANLEDCQICEEALGEDLEVKKLMETKSSEDLHTVIEQLSKETTQVRRPEADVNMRNWMTCLPEYATRKPLNELAIPGSHDSGAWPILSSSLPVANDETGLVARLGKAKWVRKGIRRWAITQSLNIVDQLNSGIRYFDLRVSHPPEKLRPQIGDFRLVHALYGPLLKTTLGEMRDFLDANPGEVLLLDVNHVFGIQEHDQCVALQNLLISTFGSKLCPPTSSTYSLDRMRRSKYQVIAWLCFQGRSPLWTDDRIISEWPETNDERRLIGFIDNQLSVVRPDNMRSFFVLQGILTATIKDVVIHWRSSLERRLAKRATSRVLEWTEGLGEKQKSLVNIVMVDFVDEDVARRVVELNY